MSLPAIIGKTSPDSIDSNLQLPAFTETSTPVFTWGNHSAKVFPESLDKTYAEVMHWTRYFFPVPLGKAGKDFVSELSRLFQAFGIASTSESIALKAATVLPILLLQKPYRASKTKDHIICLERRLMA